MPGKGKNDSGDSGGTISGNRNKENVLIGTDQDDVILGGKLDDLLRGNNGNDFLQGGPGNDEMYGDAGNDRMFGGSGADLMEGGAGNDELFGETGNDSLYGGDGDDVLIGGYGSDIIDGGEGFDIASFEDVNGWVQEFSAYDAEYEFTYTDYIYHGITVTSSEPGTYDVSLKLSGTVNETEHSVINIEGIWGSQSDDHITGNRSGELLAGLYGNDTIDGADGNDTIYGDGDNDALRGGDGDDVLFGGSGDDMLTGGADADHFVFVRYADGNPDTADSGSGDGVDVIWDFDLSEDKIFLLGNEIFEYELSGNDAGDVVLTYDTVGGFYGGPSEITLDGVFLADVDLDDLAAWISVTLIQDFVL